MQSPMKTKLNYLKMQTQNTGKEIRRGGNKSGRGKRKKRKEKKFKSVLKIHCRAEFTHMVNKRKKIIQSV